MLEISWNVVDMARFKTHLPGIGGHAFLTLFMKKSYSIMISEYTDTDHSVMSGGLHGDYELRAVGPSHGDDRHGSIGVVSTNPWGLNKLFIGETVPVSLQKWMLFRFVICWRS